MYTVSQKTVKIVLGIILPKSRTDDIYGLSLRINNVRRCTNMLRCNSMT